MNKPIESLLLQPDAADYLKNAAARLDARAEAAQLDRGARVGISRPHESAHLHVAGEATYIDDIPELAGTLHCALGLAPVAAGTLTAMALERIRELPGVVAVMSAADIPGANDCGSIVHDDPILCDFTLRADGTRRGEIRYFGQPVFAVIAETRDLARRAAAKARDVLTIEPAAPVLTPQQAHAKQQYVVPPMHLVRSTEGGAEAAIARAPHRLAGTLDVGGQEQFYLEGQISYALPTEGGGMHVHCSTQHPSEMQHLVAHALGVHAHDVRVECRRMGGGFGGKESQSGLFACVAAVAAAKLKRPVKLRLDRDDDFMITGRRHCFWYEYEVGYDDAGRVLGAEIVMVSRAGHSADLSGPVMTRALCHFDNAYWLPDVAMHGFSGRTNTQSNTAFRGFGGPQGAIAIENILDSIARILGKDPLDVRRVNFYGAGPVRAEIGEGRGRAFAVEAGASTGSARTGMGSDPNPAREPLPPSVRAEPVEASHTSARVEPVEAPHTSVRAEPVEAPARGQSTQAPTDAVPGAPADAGGDGVPAGDPDAPCTALVSPQPTIDPPGTSRDGRVERNVTPYGQVITDNVIHELTAELETTSDYRARRAAIATFNATSPVLKRGLALVPLKFGISFNVKHFNQAGALVHVYSDGSILVNHGGTEMGQGLNTKVAQVVAHELGVGFDRVRCSATDTHKVANTSATAASTGADLNGKAAQDAARQIKERLAACLVAHHGGAAQDVLFANDQVQVNGKTLTFPEVIAQGYLDRVQLWSDGFYATPGLSWDRDRMFGRPFYYFAYGAAVSEVVVDTLTGEWRLLRADILQDAGASLNPAVDIGQVEGAFIQGMGWLTMEELVWHPQTGKLTTHAPSTYKIPTANDCPPVFNCQLWQGRNVEDSIHRSKAVGEPPLLLPFSVFYAIRDAVSAAGGHRIDPPLSAPATSEAILRAVTAVMG